MSNDTTETVLAIGGLALAAYFGFRAFNASTGPGRDVGGFFGGIVNGASNIVNDTFGGVADIGDRLNPFTDGPIVPWF